MMRLKLKDNNNKAYALIVTIYVIVIFSAIGITIAAFISSESIGNVLTLSGIKSIHIAEGGAEYALAKDLLVDYDWSDNNGQTNSNIALGDGEFDTVIRSYEPTICTIEASGYFNRGNVLSEIRREVEVTLQRNYEEALLGAMYAANRINLNNGSGTINDGDLVSGSDIVSQMTGEHDLASNESISIPPIDWDQYRALAQASGNYYSGDLELDNQTVNGIIFAEGNVDIEDDVIVNGSIITMGNVNMNQADYLYVSAEASYPAIMANGHINGTQSGSGYINGLVYASDNITMNNNDDMVFNGGIVSGGRISMVNANFLSLTYDPKILLTPFVGVGASVTITRWRNL
ncbi:MAG: hypothetical protein HQ564_02140 [Candidatus Saganbacteria bacterium]|nr:hypothetical protein [Candidatus Saganbacteria bacterium]